MEYVSIDRLQINKSKRLKDKINSESLIYIDEDNLYKIFLPTVKKSERKITCEKLSEVDDERLVVPKFGINDSRNNFRGICIQYLKDYSTLLNYIKSNYLTLEERKRICYAIKDICDCLELLGFSFIDVHLGNFMIKDSSLKAIDLDSCILRDRFSDSRMKARDMVRQNSISEICLSILFNTPVFLSCFNVKELVRRANDKEALLIRSAHYEDIDKFDIKESVDSFDDYYIETNRRLIL